jgi:hypothetical protein
MSFFARLEQMRNAIWNQGGVKMDTIIWSQGVRRDTIAGERGQMVYDSAASIWTATSAPRV